MKLFIVQDISCAEAEQAMLPVLAAGACEALDIVRNTIMYFDIYSRQGYKVEADNGGLAQDGGSVEITSKAWTCIKARIVRRDII